MIKFPTLCVDNYYKDPESIRQYASTLEYHSDTRYPGLRTDSLYLLNPELFHKMNRKFFSLFFDFDKEYINWFMSSHFELNNSISENENSFMNKGYIHHDIGAILVGIVYLTPNINRNTGTSMFRVKYPYSQEDEIKDTDIRKNFYIDKIDKGYEKCIENVYSHYEKTIEFSNQYNRIICFPGENYHATNSYFTNEERLTQLFFVSELESDCSFPLDRCDREEL